MFDFSLPSSSDPSARASFYHVLGNWLDAITAFQEHYHRLNHSLASCDPDGEQFSRFMSQCSSRQVSDLLAKMCHELAALVEEVDDPIDLSGLINHTNRLNSLTNQARVVINLLNQSSC